MPIKYEPWPPQATGGQHVGTGPNGVRGVHYIGDYPTGFEAVSDYHRSQHKNRIVVQEMIEWALASANVKERP